ncbi:MAG: molybdopterin molybdotransferase MoeA, partial [Anaerolineae bacterium]|nr:molybdopterin molybdotransferase MoeA [Anaerolineae bacterium]
MPKLTSVDDAIYAILQQIEAVSIEQVSLADNFNRVLAEEITSDIDLPPFDNSAMDGFAIYAEDSEPAPVTLQVTMDIRAGAAPQTTLQRGQAARIMTGAPVPPGANAVIPVEDTDNDFSQLDAQPMPSTVTLHKTVTIGNSIRKAGESIYNGQKVLQPGRIIGAAEIGMLASLGHAIVSVVRKPRVVILGTGDELIPVDQPLAPGQIHDSNSYTLAALVQQHGGEAIRLPIAADEPGAIRALFQAALAQEPDLLISSAGVSVGAADYVRTILEELGSLQFWRINMRPGKPLVFGNIQGVPFFGLPGNPVSAMVTFDVIVRPALLKLAGRPDTARYVETVVAETMHSDGRRTFARVSLQEQDGRWLARETGTQSSGALVSMLLADGLLIIPEGIEQLEAGSSATVRL